MAQAGFYAEGIEGALVIPLEGQAASAVLRKPAWRRHPGWYGAVGLVLVGIGVGALLNHWSTSDTQFEGVYHHAGFPDATITFLSDGRYTLQLHDSCNVTRTECQTNDVSTGRYQRSGDVLTLFGSGNLAPTRFTLDPGGIRDEQGDVFVKLS